MVKSQWSNIEKDKMIQDVKRMKITEINKENERINNNL